MPGPSSEELREALNRLVRTRLTEANEQRSVKRARREQDLSNRGMLCGGVALNSHLWGATDHIKHVGEALTAECGGFLEKARCADEDVWRYADELVTRSLRETASEADSDFRRRAPGRDWDDILEGALTEYGTTCTRVEQAATDRLFAGRVALTGLGEDPATGAEMEEGLVTLREIAAVSRIALKTLRNRRALLGEPAQKREGVASEYRWQDVRTKLRMHFSCGADDLPEAFPENGRIA